MKDGGRFIVCQLHDCCLGTETTLWHENKVRLPVRDDVTDRREVYCDGKSWTCVMDSKRLDVEGYRDVSYNTHSASCLSLFTLCVYKIVIIKTHLV